MSRKSIVVAVAGAFAVVMGLGSAAHAIEYGTDLVLPQDDGTWQVHVEGFEAGDDVTVTLACTGDATVTLGTTTAESDGTIDEFYKLPAGTTSKTCAIRVVGGAVSKSFAVGLPGTGSNSLSALAIAGALLAAGAVIVGLSSLGRRRSHA